MKKLILFAFIVLLSFAGCRTSKNVTELDELVEVDLLFNKSKYRSDKKFVRAIGFGKSDNYYTSLEIARVNSISQISYNINLLVENLSDYYISQVNTSYDKYERITRQVSRHILSDLNIVEEKLFYDENTKEFSSWVVMEVDRDNIINKFQFNLKQDNVEIGDKRKYENVLDNTMNKFTD